jgi:ABC-type transport system involved in multi-copper enzyme maturation permease subunit
MSAETHLEVYRPFQGKLREHPLRFWPITGTGLRTALKQRKALLLLYMPAFIGTVTMCFTVYLKTKAQTMMGTMGGAGEMDLREQLMQGAILGQAEQMLNTVNIILNFSKAMGLWSLLAVTWFASGLFCEDRKAGAHQLYFARPITRFDYLLGKFLIACTFAGAAVILPPLIVSIVASFTTPEWAFLKEEWDVFPRSILFGAIWTVTVSSLVLAASSLASRKSFALLGTFAFLFLSAAISGILGHLVHERFLALNLFDDLNTVAHSIFQRSDGFRVPVAQAWTAVITLVALCWGLMWMRLRRLEVVA